MLAVTLFDKQHVFIVQIFIFLFFMLNYYQLTNSIIFLIPNFFSYIIVIWFLNLYYVAIIVFSILLYTSNIDMLIVFYFVNIGCIAFALRKLFSYNHNTLRVNLEIYDKFIKSYSELVLQKEQYFLENYLSNLNKIDNMMIEIEAEMIVTKNLQLKKFYTCLSEVSYNIRLLNQIINSLKLDVICDFENINIQSQLRQFLKDFNYKNNFSLKYCFNSNELKFNAYINYEFFEKILELIFDFYYKNDLRIINAFYVDRGENSYYKLVFLFNKNFLYVKEINRLSILANVKVKISSDKIEIEFFNSSIYVVFEEDLHFRQYLDSLIAIYRKEFIEKKNALTQILYQEYLLNTTQINYVVSREK